MPFTFYYFGVATSSQVNVETVIGNYSVCHSLDSAGYSPPWLPHLLENKENKVCGHTVCIIKRDACHLDA